MTPGDSDAELMARVKRGDRAAFRVLVERHQRTVINVIYRSIGDAWEAEDLAQRVFVQVYRAAGRYEPTAKFTTWLFTIVHHLVLNEYRRRSRRTMESLEAMAQPEAEVPVVAVADERASNPAEVAALRELQRRISEAVERLPAQQRTAVILCRYEGQSYEEIGRVLRCSVSAVKSLLHRARRTLKEELRGYY